MLLKLLYNSVKLDVLFCKSCPLSIVNKIEVVLKKYYLICKHITRQFILGTSSINIQNKKYFYNSDRYGIASLQAEWTTHYPLIKNLKNIETILDIGASVGNFTLMCDKVFPTAKKFAIEPVPLSYEALVKNCSIIADCTNEAVSNRNGIQSLDINSLTPETSSLLPRGEFQVKVETLDEFVKNKNIETLSLVKIDVEKYEHVVLEGAASALAKTKYMLIEVTNQDNTNYTTAELFSLLKTKNYNFTTRAVTVYPNGHNVYMIDYLLENILL